MRLLARPENSLDRRVRQLEAVPRSPMGTSWAPLAFAPPWVNIGGINQVGEYRRGPDGIVHLRGAIRCLVTPSTFDTIATLPAGFHAPASAIFCVNTDSGAGRVDFHNGSLLYVNGDFATYLSLDGVTFDTR